MMRAKTRSLLAALGILVLANASQADERSSAMAEQLFREGRTLMKANRAEEACPKLAESARLEVASGTLLSLAECYEAIGRTASAWVRYEELRTLAERQGQTERANYASNKLKDIEPKLFYLSLDIGTPVAEGLTLRADGVELGRAAWTSRLPVDPGSHRIVAEAPGFTVWEKEIDVRQREQRVAVPALSRKAVPLVPVAPVAPSPASPSSPLMPVAFTLAVVAGASALATVGFSIAAKVEYNHARDQECTAVSCGDAGLERIDRSITFGNVATATLVAAAVTGAGSALFFFLASRSPKKSALSTVVRF